MKITVVVSNNYKNVRVVYVSVKSLMLASVVDQFLVYLFTTQRIKIVLTEMYLAITFFAN